MDKNISIIIRKVIFLLVTIISIGCAARVKETMPVSVQKQVSIPAPVKYPGSLWPGETHFNTLFADSKARRIGDIVTINIVEVSSASKEAETSTKRDSSIFAGINNFFGIAESNINPAKVRAFDASKMIDARASNKFNGSGATSRRGTLTGKISAIVTDVLPNGNIVIEGKRSIVVNNEDQIFVLRGVVRPEDISPTNEVSSTTIANASITYTGRGIIADKQRPGWFFRFFDKVWPF